MHLDNSQFTAIFWPGNLYIERKIGGKMNPNYMFVLIFNKAVIEPDDITKLLNFNQSDFDEQEIIRLVFLNNITNQVYENLEILLKTRLCTLANNLKKALHSKYHKIASENILRHNWGKNIYKTNQSNH